MTSSISFRTGRLFAAGLLALPSVTSAQMIAVTGQAESSNTSTPFATAQTSRSSFGTSEALADFDVRENDPATQNRIVQLGKSGVMARREQARTELIARTPRLAIDINPALATPDFVRSTTSFLSETVVGPVDGVAITKQYIKQNADLFGIEPTALDAARVTRDAVTAHNGVRTVWWQQEIEGVPVVGCDLRVNILPDGRIASIGSRMLPVQSLEQGARAPATLSRQRAIAVAGGDLGIEMPATLTIVHPGAGEPTRPVVFARTAQLSRDITTDSVYFPVSFNDVRPAHRVVMAPAGEANIYEVIIDAANGLILQRRNLTVYGGPGSNAATYNVWTSDSPAPLTPGPDSPNGVQGPIVARELVTIEAFDSIASPLGWITPDLNETLGNNIDAHTDLDDDEQPDLPRPQGVPFRVFDFPIDLALAPSTYRPASVTQGFYVSNLYHDQLHQLGFTEGFGNFQADNFGRGGVGGDWISLDVHDGGGTNNANFSSQGSDGSFARIQMFIFTGPNPDRDGNLDSHILVHELTHGTSIRLHGGLGGNQGGGMGEGWSDFYALALLAEPGDPLDGVYALSGYATLDGVGIPFADNYYFGIRRFPYTTDLSKNPLTFGDINDSLIDIDPSIPINPVFGSSNPSEVHNVGEVWTAVLWEGRANLINQHGFDGNDLMLRLVTDGMKLTTTSSPSMVQSRDAILLADLTNQNGDNVCLLWDGFAKRGLGFDAFSVGNGAGTIGEAFNAPAGLDLAIDGGAPTLLAPGTPTSFSVRITPSCGGPLAPGSAQLMLTVDGATQPIALEPTGDSEIFTATLPPLACGVEASYYLTATTTESITVTFPSNAPDDAIQLSILTDSLVSFEDDFEENLGWTVSGDATAGQWERGVPAGDGDRGDPITDGDGSGQAFLTQNGPGNTDVDQGATTLASPALDATGDGDARIEFSLWYVNDFNSSVDDVFTIELSNDDGASWMVVEELANSTSGWEMRTLRIADFLAPTSTMRVRFTASDTGQGSIVEAGVDGVRLTRFICNVSGGGPDLNGDGIVNGADLAALLANWGSPGATDLNGDGATDGADLAALLANWG